MKKIRILVLAASLLACLVPSAHAAKPAKAAKAAAAKGAKKAQQTVLEKYDKNSNGFIDADEVEAIQKAFGKDAALKPFDKDGDGKLDDIEVSAINPTAKKKKK